MRSFITALSRRSKIALVLGVDAVLLPAAVWLAMSFRFGDLWWAESWREFLPILVATISALVAFYVYGVYRTVLRYMDASVVGGLLKGVSFGSLGMTLAVFLAGAHYPRSIPLIFWFIGLLLCGGVRVFAQMYLRGYVGAKRTAVVIYGAGEAGVQLGMALRRGQDYHLVAYVDDDPSLRGMVLHGVGVYAPQHIPFLKKKHDVSEIFIAMPSITPGKRKDVLLKIERYELRVRTVPSLKKIMREGVRPEDVHDVDPADLLGRDPVPPKASLMGTCITGKTVLVSGAGGSIGSELCRQIVTLLPKRLVLFDVSECALYQIEQELRSVFDGPVVAILGSVQHGEYLASVMCRYEVNTVYHAAAYKHVPMVEGNVVEGIRNNVFGTLAAVRAAIKAGVSSFILISTDKAVRPTNIMGATKRLAEIILQVSSMGKTGTRFSMVRFGNVLGSSGSVVPLFKAQIRAGGPVTVTHPDIIRYFMTIPEAAQLVIQAGAMARGGDVFLLDMGEPVRIADLARRMIHLMGHRVRQEGDESGIGIEYAGLRPGEKLYEELLVGEEDEETEHPRIRRAVERSLDNESLENAMVRLHDLCASNDVAGIYQFLLGLDIGFLPAVNLNEL